MEKLKLYTVDTDYIKYLYSKDDRVMFWESKHYTKERKYLGIVLVINGFNYFAPLSSPKESDYFYKKGKKLIRKNTIPIVRLISGKGKLLGKIKLSNMIPVSCDKISLYNINDEQDKKYKDLIQDEMISVRKNRDEILKNAKVLYNQKTKGYEGINYLDYTVDFKKLEKACLDYK